MSIRKKIIAIFLCVVFALTFSYPAYGISTKQVSFNEKDYSTYLYLTQVTYNEIISNFPIITCCETNSLYFGDRIPSYSYDSLSHTLQSTKATYYPCFSDNKISAIFCVSETQTGDCCIETLNEFNRLLDSFVNESICFLFADDYFFIMTSQDLILLKHYSGCFNRKDTKIDSDISIDELTNIIISELLSSNTTLDKQPLTARYLYTDLISCFGSEIGKNQQTNQLLDSFPDEFYMNATVVQQYGQPICWAAVVASIGLEVTGISYTAAYVSNYMLGSLAGGNTYLALLALQSLYNIDGTQYYYAPSFNVIKDMIYNAGHPMYVRVYGAPDATHSSALNHAIFVDGYQVFSSGSVIGRILVGEPNDGYHRSISFTTSGVYAYTLAGQIGYIDEYIFSC